MLVENLNDIVTSNNTYNTEDNGNFQSIQKVAFPTMTSQSSSNHSYNHRHIREDVSSSDTGRNSVVSDPGYISCAGSDQSSEFTYSPRGETLPGQEDCCTGNILSGGRSPCDMDILSDNSTNAFYKHLYTLEDFMPENIQVFKQDTDSMSNYYSSFTGQLEKSLCQRVKTIPSGTCIAGTREQVPSITLSPSKNFSRSTNNNQSRSRSSDEVLFHQNNLDMLLEGNYMNGNRSTSINSQLQEKNHSRLTVPKIHEQYSSHHKTVQDYSIPAVPNSKSLSVEDFSLSVEDFCFETEMSDFTDQTNNNIGQLSPCSAYSPRTYSELQTTPEASPDRNIFTTNKFQQPCGYDTKSYAPITNGLTPSTKFATQCPTRPNQLKGFIKASDEKTIPAMTSSSDVKPRFTTATSAEEEAWRSYLENPLTAATTAMMSIQGDEDSAAALGMLYDYYKVPREKRLLSYPSSEPPQKKTTTSLKAATPTGDSTMHPVTTMDDLAPENLLSVRSIKSEPKTPTQIFSPPGSLLNLSKPQVNEVPQDLSTQSFAELNNKFATNLPVTSPQDNRDVITPMTHFNPNNNNNNCFTNSQFSTVSSIPQYSMPIQSSFVNLLPNSGNNLMDLNCPGDVFEYVMEAPKSLKQKDGEPTMSYINKGQFYCITLRESSQNWMYKSTKVKSVVHIIFGDSKPEEEQLRHWKYWHARQHTVKQRILDIADYKESNMIYDVEETAHNAISFSWDVTEMAKIYISCNCLSTDFSAQKGIKGLPLLLQIDTYVEQETTPAHRGQCQIKVFCDKGAERKIRDEERKASRRKRKTTTSGMDVVSPPRGMTLPATSSATSQSTSQKKIDYVRFKTMKDLKSRPFLFAPELSGHSTSLPHMRTPTMSPCDPSGLSPHSTTHHSMIPDQDSSFFSNPMEEMDRGMKRSHSLMSSEDSEMGSVCKFPRSADHDVTRRVLLYVRKQDEEVYDGLMLKSPDLQGLKLAIEEKHQISADKITKIFKKSKKGILVHMDDNIIRHYSNEDTFIIEIQSTADGNYKVTFTEV